MAFKEYDVFVIGTGTAGKMVAKNCAAKGLTVAIADNREYGGTCPNRGCDPKKVLVGLTEILDRAKKMQGKGISKMPEHSWEDLMAFKETFVNAVPAATEKDLIKAEIELYHQSPRFLNENSLSVEGKTVTAKKIVIATGQKARKLDIPGINHALESDDFLNLEKLPKSMIFIGGGYIAMEFAHIAARFNVKVTIIQSSARPLKEFDRDMVAHILQASEELGIAFVLNARANAIEKRKGGLVVKADQNGKEILVKAEMVFNTSGRVPSIDELDLEKGNVDFSQRGVIVNEYLQSPSNKRVFACGDVSASEGLPLTPLSSQEAEAVSANILNKGKFEKVHYPPQPSAVFTLPNLASVGMLEEEAKEKGYDYTLEQKLVPDWFSAKRINESFYAYKTLVDNETGYILGVHLVGPEAAEIINIFSLAMAANLPAKKLKDILYAYPTWGSDIKAMI